MNWGQLQRYIFMEKEKRKEKCYDSENNVDAEW